MKEINRSILTVHAKESFLHWLNSLPDPVKYTLDEVNYDQSAFLLPEYEADNRMENLCLYFYVINIGKFVLQGTILKTPYP